MQYFFLGIALLAALVLIGRWFVSADPHKVLTAAKWSAVSLFVVLGALFIFSGRIALFLPMLLLVLWLRKMLSRATAARGPSSGQSSEVRTKFLQMTLDHDSGALDGEILDGRYVGQFLSQLDLAALRELLRDYHSVDPQSASVLEAYLDRTQAEDWRAEAPDGAEQNGAGKGRSGWAGGGAGNGEGQMSREEALKLLGLEEGADAEAIREAHRHLMQKFHPDHGGSNYLAAKLNEAKDLLLRH